MKLPTREQLVKRRQIVISDAQMKLEIADWHGCADACMDLREIDAQIALWDVLRENGALIGANVLEQTGAFAPESSQWPESVHAERIAAARPVLPNDGWADRTLGDLEGARIAGTDLVVGKRVDA